MQDISSLFKKGSEIFKNGIDVFFLIQLIVLGISILIGVFIYLFSVLGLILFSAVIGTISSEKSLVAVVGIILVGLLISLVLLAIFAFTFLLQSIGQGAMVIAMQDVLNNKKKSFSNYFKEAFEIKWQLIGLIVLQTLLILLGAIFFVIPGLLISFMVSLAVYPLVYKKKKIWESIKESFHLVASNFWPVLGRYALLLLVIWGIMAVTSWIPMANFAVGIISGIVSSIFTFLIYKELSSKEKEL